MRLHAAYAAEQALVFFKLRFLLHKAIKLCIVYGYYFGGNEGICAFVCHKVAHQLALHGVIEAVGGVLVGLTHGVVGKAAYFQIGLVARLQEAVKRVRAFAQPALIGFGHGDVFLRVLKRLFPKLVRCKKVFRCPSVLLVYLAALGYFFLCCHLHISPFLFIQKLVKAIVPCF